ncbi:MAG: hypothetical protein K6G28_04920, partial [Acholeplasmatales bacterium]|nr:hypothetical protein [Acholeplasmatales bacterium]
MSETCIVKPKSKRALLLSNFGWTFKRNILKENIKFEEYERLDTIPYYDKFKAYETEYMRLEASKREYKPISLFFTLILFMLLVVPAIVYLIETVINKHLIEKNNRKIRMKQARIINNCKLLN